MDFMKHHFGKIEYIRVSFENCDVVDIPINNILGFTLSEIKTSMMKVNTDELFVQQIANYLYMKIDNDALNIETNWGKLDKTDSYKFGEHLPANDIVAVRIKMVDSEDSIYIYIPWKGDEYKNESMFVERKENYFTIEIKVNTDAK